MLHVPSSAVQKPMTSPAGACSSAWARQHEYLHRVGPTPTERDSPPSRMWFVSPNGVAPFPSPCAFPSSTLPSLLQLACPAGEVWPASATRCTLRQDNATPLDAASSCVPLLPLAHDLPVRRHVPRRRALQVLIVNPVDLFAQRSMGRANSCRACASQLLE